MNKWIVSLLIASFATLQSFGVDYDTWAMESNVSPYTATSRYWRVTLGSNGNVDALITRIESLPDNPDPTTMDVAGLLGMYMKPNYDLKSFIARTGGVTGDAVSGITKIIVSDKTYNYLELRGLPNLTEVRTVSDAKPYVFSVLRFGEYAWQNPQLTGAVEINDVISIGKGTFKQSCLSDVRLKGSFSGFASTMTFQLCANLSYFSAESTLPLTTLANETSFNGAAIECAYFPEATSLGKSAFLSCSYLKDLVLPSVTSFGSETGFGYCANLWNVVFGTTSQMTISGKNARGSFGNASNARVIFNTKVQPVFSGDLYFLVDASTALKVYVRKEADWKNASDATHKAVFEEDNGKWYWRSGSGVTSWQHEMKFMDTAIKLNVQTNGVTVFTTILPGMAGEDAVYTMPKLMVVPPEARVTGVQSLTPGVTAVRSADKQGITVTVPSTMFPAPSDTETMDLEVNVSFTPAYGHPGLILIYR